MRVAQALLAVASVVAVATGASSAAATPRAQTVKVAFLQGEQVVFLDRPCRAASRDSRRRRAPTG